MEHIPVLANETIVALKIKPGGIYVDATFGRGGHSRLILNALGKNGRLYMFDRDLTAIDYAKKNFPEKNAKVCHASFLMIEQILAKENLVGKIDGLMADLGVSSPQLDDATRGFSFMKEGPLDCRLDNTQGEPVSTFINKAHEHEIADVLYSYGEERYAKRLAKAIVQKRVEKAITTTLQLANIIRDAHPRWPKNIHPATKSFLALRLYINEELSQCEALLKSALKLLSPGGRMAFITFHSLEDRIVKQFFKKNALGQKAPSYLPIKETKKPPLTIIQKSQKPTIKEIDKNPRSRSARLRVAEKNECVQ